MGEVYRARDGRLGSRRCHQSASAAFSSNSEVRARFSNAKPKTVSSLNHPKYLLCCTMSVARATPIIS
jgi:hypothetical protein